jgi:hypothetical protein
MLKLSPLLATLTIQGKDVTEGLVKFPIDQPFAWAGDVRVERLYNSRKPVRIIVQKARQLGISAAEGYCSGGRSFIQAIPRYRARTSRHKPYSKGKLYWDTWPYKNL